ncbi:RDD family protein [Pedobacter psychrodurus]|uniref:RDD family protein n=1 Tax=Pedobacter psychrodurus TaxID=2530456 RepID=UPI00292DCA29|nr:RDD family protein [Pedobacter psychrodurus]
MRQYKTNIKKRVYASISDYGLFFICYLAYLIFFGEHVEEGTYSISGSSTLPVFLFWLIYFVISEGMYGATLGHQSFNLKVVTLHGERIGFTQALKRRLLDPIDFFCFGLIAFIIVKNSEKHQRVGDTFAKTHVIDTTDPEQNLGPIRPFN